MLEKGREQIAVGMGLPQREQLSNSIRHLASNGKISDKKER
jgi:hypothetical protein